jgi:hypothetical protein
VPQSYHYHSASAIIENGDFDGAVAQAKERAKASLVRPEPRTAEPQAVAPLPRSRV